MTTESIALAGKGVRVEVLYDGKLVLHTLVTGRRSTTILASACAGTFRFPGEFAVAMVRVLVGPVSIRSAEILSSGVQSDFEMIELKSGAEKKFNSQRRTLELIVEEANFVQLLIDTKEPTKGNPNHTKDLGKHN